MDVSNHKFNEILTILATLFYHIKAQAPTAEAYDALTLNMNTNLQKVFDHLWEFHHSTLLASVAKPSNARGGEGPSNKYHSIS